MIEFKPEAYLVPWDKRPANREGLLGEENMLKNPLFDELTKRMIEEYVPQHKFAIFSLCAATKPFIKSMKWKAFYKNFGNVADMIVGSSGGIIPMEYCYCYPFMQYDGHMDPDTMTQHTNHSPETNELYKKKFLERLDMFIQHHGDKYEKIIFSFLPTTRNREVLMDYCKGHDNWYIGPSMEVYKRIQQEGSPGVNIMRFPQIAHQHLDEMAQFFGIQRPKKRTLF